LCDYLRRTDYRGSDRRYTPTQSTDGSPHNKYVALPSDVAATDPLMFALRSKSERIQQLRHHHQHSHRERHGRYVHDEQDDVHEQQLKQYEQVSLEILLPASTPE